MEIDLGDRLRRARVSLELSQEQLARLCGVTQAQFSKLERGENLAGTATAVAIERTLRKMRASTVVTAVQWAAAQARVRRKSQQQPTPTQADGG